MGNVSKSFININLQFQINFIEVVTGSGIASTKPFVVADKLEVPDIFTKRNNSKNNSLRFKIIYAWNFQVGTVVDQYLIWIFHDLELERKMEEKLQIGSELSEKEILCIIYTENIFVQRAVAFGLQHQLHHVRLER